MTPHVLHPFERFDQSTIAAGRSQFLIRLSYKGSCFRGVPPQPGLPSVSDALQNQITQSLGQPLKALTFTARTDKGVDAQVNYATGWLKDGPKIPDAGIQISSQDTGLGPIYIFPVVDKVFARTIGLSKTYSYAFRDNFLADDKDSIAYWDVLPKLSVENMQKAASCLIGTHSFDSFQVRSGKEDRDTSCTIYSATIESIPKDNHREIVFEIRGNRFLRRMIRTLAGTLAEIGCGLMPPQDMRDLLTDAQTQWVGPTAPARGLVLQNIELIKELEHLFD